MQLLVSVASDIDAAAALDGGADIIDAKDPRAGALGAVSLEVFGEIRAGVANRRPLSAAIGDAADEAAIARTASAFAAAGAAFVKVGLNGVAGAARAASLAAAAQRGLAAAGSGRNGLVVVAYADPDQTAGIAPDALIEIAARSGATGVLLDTADKNGRGLIALMSPAALTVWVARAHVCGLLVAVAGKLTADDLPVVREAGAD